MNQTEFLACSDFQKWAEILIARETYLPEAAEAAYIETTTDERDKLYEATGLVLTRRALQIYCLRLEAKGYGGPSRAQVPRAASHVRGAVGGGRSESEGGFHPSRPLLGSIHTRSIRPLV
jgi:hypothetical protein